MSTDNYYDREETQFSADEHYESFMRAALDVPVLQAQAEQVMEDIRQMLSAAWDLAGENVEAQMKISETWALVSVQQANMEQMITTVDGAKQALEVLNAARNQAEEALRGVQDALDDLDENHPMVQSFADSIRESERDWVENYLTDAITEELEEEREYSDAESIRRVLGVTWEEAQTLRDTLFGDTKYGLEDDEREWLAAFTRRLHASVQRGIAEAQTVAQILRATKKGA